MRKGLPAFQPPSMLQTHQSLALVGYRIYPNLPVVEQDFFLFCMRSITILLTLLLPRERMVFWLLICFEAHQFAFPSRQQDPPLLSFCSEHFGALSNQLDCSCSMTLWISEETAFNRRPSNDRRSSNFAEEARALISVLALPARILST